MIIHDFLDNDLYKFTVMNAIQKKFPGFTMFWGGTSVILFLTLIALVEHYFAKELMAVPFSMLYLPKLTEIFHPMTIIAACVTGFLLSSLSTYLYYATLQTATAETFMTFREKVVVMLFVL